MMQTIVAGVFWVSLCLAVVSTPAARAQTDANQKTAFLIGNSLTWDTLPGLLDGSVAWHVDCGKNLKYIAENPKDPCVRTSVPWTTALKRDRFQILCVQPHFGTSLDEDVQAISAWVDLQPAATLVIHTGWDRHRDFAKHYPSMCQDQQMVHAPAYFALLKQRLAKRHPKLEIRSTHAIEVLHEVCCDIKAGTAPVDSLQALYRDDIHVTTGGGRYLMHNLMRLAIGQEISEQGFQVERPLQRYLHAKLTKLRSRRLAASSVVQHVSQ